MIRRGFLGWVLGLVLISYVLMSVGLAMSTKDDCDVVSGGKQHWVLVPPQWECGAGQIQIFPDDE